LEVSTDTDKFGRECSQSKQPIFGIWYPHTTTSNDVG
jgi:hypothetical protein